MSERFLTIAEVCRVLRVSRPTAMRAVKAGMLPAGRVGSLRGWRVSSEALAEFVRGKRAVRKAKP